MDDEVGTRPLSEQEVAALTNVLLVQYLEARDQDSEPQGRGVVAYDMIERLPWIGQRWRSVQS